jgi:hypothetical protein
VVDVYSVFQKGLIPLLFGYYYGEKSVKKEGTLHASSPERLFIIN